MNIETYKSEPPNNCFIYNINILSSKSIISNQFCNNSNMEATSLCE